MAAAYNNAVHSKPGNTPLTTLTKRRMFPMRPTPPSALNSLDPNCQGGISPLDYHLPHDFAGENYQDYLSDDGSSGSSGTVKISALSSLELPNTNAGWDSDADDQRLPLTPILLGKYYGIAAGTNLPSTPTPSRALANHRNETLSTPSHYINKALRRTVRWNSRAEVYNPGQYWGLEGCRSLPDLRTAAYDFEHAADIQTNPTKTVNHTPLNDTIHTIAAWDTSVKLCTAFTLSQRGEIEVHHHIELTVTIPKQEISTTRVKLRLQISNGLETDQCCNLDRGKSSIFIEHDTSSSWSDQKDADVNIIRDTVNVEEPLNIYLHRTFSATDKCPVVWFPTCRPFEGKTLSESVFVSEPAPPLILKSMLREDFSTWKLSPISLNHVMCFRRVTMPPLYPDGLQDDVRIRVMIPSPVRFRSIRNLNAADLVWDAEIKVAKRFGSRLQCHMSLWLEVGMGNNLLVMDSHGWIANYFLVDNRPATEAGGEWRIDEGRMILFKQSDQPLGPIKIEMNWTEPANEDQSNGDGVNQLLLPRVVDREVLGASFAGESCGVVTCNNPGIKDNTFLCEEGSPTRLPVLHKGYSMHVKPEYTESHSNELAENDCDVGNAISHPPIRHLVTQVSITFVLIFSLFLTLHTTRLHNYDMILRECSLHTPDTVKFFGDSGVHERSAKGLAVAAHLHDTFNGEDGWRDWVDTSLGWKGYTS